MTDIERLTAQIKKLNEHLAELIVLLPAVYPPGPWTNTSFDPRPRVGVRVEKV